MDEIKAVLGLDAGNMIETLDQVIEKAKELEERLEHIHQLLKELAI